jgi:hypothetical protein
MNDNDELIDELSRIETDEDFAAYLAQPFNEIISTLKTETSET